MSEQQLKADHVERITTAKAVRHLDHAVQAFRVGVGITAPKVAENLALPVPDGHLKRVESFGDGKGQAVLPSLVGGHCGLGISVVVDVKEPFLVIVSVSQFRTAFAPDCQLGLMLIVQIAATPQKNVAGTHQVETNTSLERALVFLPDFVQAFVGDLGDVELVHDDASLGQDGFDGVFIRLPHVNADNLDVVFAVQLPEVFANGGVFALGQQVNNRIFLKVGDDATVLANEVKLINPDDAAGHRLQFLFPVVRVAPKDVPDNVLINADLVSDMGKRLVNGLVFNPPRTTARETEVGIKLRVVSVERRLARLAAVTLAAEVNQRLAAMEQMVNVTDAPRSKGPKLGASALGALGGNGQQFSPDDVFIISKLLRVGGFDVCHVQDVHSTSFTDLIHFSNLSFSHANRVVVRAAMANKHQFYLLKTVLLAHANAIPAKTKHDSIICKHFGNGASDAGIERRILCILHPAFDSSRLVTLANLPGRIWRIEDGKVTSDTLSNEHLEEVLSIHVVLSLRSRIQVVGVICPPSIPRKWVARAFGRPEIALHHRANRRHAKRAFRCHRPNSFERGFNHIIRIMNYVCQPCQSLFSTN